MGRKQQEDRLQKKMKINEWDGEPGWFSRIAWNDYERLAALGYTPEQLAMYYDINASEFMFYFSLLQSPLKYHYDRGILVQAGKEGIAMTDAAATGENVTQAQRLDKLRAKIEYRNNIDKVFFDEIHV